MKLWSFWKTFAVVFGGCMLLLFALSCQQTPAGAIKAMSDEPLFDGRAQGVWAVKCEYCPADEASRVIAAFRTAHPELRIVAITDVGYTTGYIIITESK